MSILRVNEVDLNDVGNASVQIANSWNVALVSGGTIRLEARTDGNVFIPGTLNVSTILQNGLPLSSLPVGSIIDKVWYSGDPVPSGFLRLDGNNYTRSAYSELSAVIGSPLVFPGTVTIFSNTSLRLSDVYSANGVLFHNGIASGNGALPTVTDSLMYSRDGGTTWIFAAAQGLTVHEGYFAANNTLGGIPGIGTSGYSTRGRFNRIASNGTGTYVITNGTANGSLYYTASAAERSGNAYIMYATSDNLNVWTKSVLTGPSNATTQSVSDGAVIAGVAFGGTQNRFVGLLDGAKSGVYLSDPKFVWSNNGINWVVQGTGVGNSAARFVGGFWEWQSIAASSNGFVATKTTQFANLRANVVYTSADGIVWQDISQNIWDLNVTGTGDRNVSFANGLFIIVTGGVPNANNTSDDKFILVSNNRTSWSRVNTNVNLNAANRPIAIFHNGFYYYTTGGASSGSPFYFSPDLATWTASPYTYIESFPSTHIANTLYGQTVSNPGTLSSQQFTYSYNPVTQFPLPFAIGSFSNTQTVLTTASFIKT